MFSVLAPRTGCILLEMGLPSQGHEDHGTRQFGVSALGRKQRIPGRIHGRDGGGRPIGEAGGAEMPVRSGGCEKRSAMTVGGDGNAEVVLWESSHLVGTNARDASDASGAHPSSSSVRESTVSVVEMVVAVLVHSFSSVGVNVGAGRSAESESDSTFFFRMAIAAAWLVAGVSRERTKYMLRQRVETSGRKSAPKTFLLFSSTLRTWVPARVFGCTLEDTTPTPSAPRRHDTSCFLTSASGRLRDCPRSSRADSVIFAIAR